MTLAPLLIAALIATASPLLAGEGHLIARWPDDDVLVWKTPGALIEGVALVRAKSEASVIIPLIACVPLAGTRAIEAPEDLGRSMRGVVVTSGEWAGCRGVVGQENFERN
jgi:hypothetical protein